jgi:hypothetical protein
MSKKGANIKNNIGKNINPEPNVLTSRLATKSIALFCVPQKQKKKNSLAT